VAEFRLQRRERVLAELRRQGSIRVTDLAALLGVSDVTVRRDISALAEQHRLTKVHGGAIPLASPPRRPRRAERRFLLGVVVPSLDFYWPTVVAGARSAAAVLGADLQLRGSSYDPREDRRQITRLIDAGQVQGLLLAPAWGEEGAEAVSAWIGELPVPSVLVERLPPSWTPLRRQLDWVRTDHGLGIELALRHLRQQGHRTIGLVLVRESPASEHLAAAWPQVCAGLGMRADLVFHESVRLSMPGHRAIIADILRRCQEASATALVVHSDPDAIAVAQFCADQGLAIPGEFGLMSIDDEVAHLAEPALSAIRPSKSHLGRAAIELLVSRLVEGDRRPTQRVLVAPDLIIRQSTVRASMR
jgi:DNA-binding LacI/PurR family transcriptional regulator